MHKIVFNRIGAQGPDGLKDADPNDHICAWLGAIIALGGAAVIAGWVWRIPVLISALPQWPTMKITTALSFVLSGISLVFVGRQYRRPLPFADVVLPLCSLTILLIMATFLITTLLQISSGLEDLIVREKSDVGSIQPGKPAVGSMIAFAALALASLISLVPTYRLTRLLRGIGWLVALVGLAAILGFAFDVPEMRWCVEGRSSGMAFHSAFLFVLNGAGLVLAAAKRAG